MDVARALKNGSSLFLGDVIPLVVGGLIFSFLTPLTLGILGGPLLAGLYRMVLSRSRENRAPRVGDIFHFEHFGTNVAAFYTLGILCLLGFALLIVPGLYLATIWFYVFALIEDRGLGLGEAMRESKAIVERNGLSGHFGLVLLLFVLSAVLTGSGRAVAGLLGLLWPPYAVAVCIAAWNDVTHAAPRSTTAQAMPEPLAR